MSDQWDEANYIFVIKDLEHTAEVVQQIIAINLKLPITYFDS